MFSFFRRRKEADATARRIIDQGRFLGARTPREAVEMLWGRPLTENEWDRYASVLERIWQESLKESEMRPPYQCASPIGSAEIARRPPIGPRQPHDTVPTIALALNLVASAVVENN
jgi:hypothetical protein